jgi:hypothetical protein
MTQNAVSQYRPENDASTQRDDLDYQTAAGERLVDSVHASWQRSAFMFGPVFTSLTAPAEGGSESNLDLQMRALESAAERIKGATISTITAAAGSPSAP